MIPKLQNLNLEKLRVCLWLYSFVAVLYLFYPASAYAWNPKSLFSGVVDAISYILLVAWAAILSMLGIRRQYLFFMGVFFFGGLGLALLNSTTRDTAITYLGKAWSAILGAT